ncbi:MAG: CGCGG family rSAM-modified RiPP protein [Thermobacillus sp.]|nr:MAG: CGCGG family rSAM-modified RiPP protein [Thermobacillus sp.]
MEGEGNGLKKQLALLKDGDWSVNLEDACYEEHPEEVLAESMDAIRRTKAGHYVNLVTPGVLGDPREWLIPRLSAMVKDADLAVREIRYIDECGCGGHVTRVYR